MWECSRNFNMRPENAAEPLANICPRCGNLARIDMQGPSDDFLKMMEDGEKIFLIYKEDKTKVKSQIGKDLCKDCDYEAHPEKLKEIENLLNSVAPPNDIYSNIEEPEDTVYSDNIVEKICF